MKLTLGEKLMILRIRKGMNYTEVGAKAFPKLLHPNVTMRKIEKGQQKASPKDVKKILKVLEVDESVLKESGDVAIDGKILKAVPELKPYINIVNQAAAIEDVGLIRSTMKSFAQKLIGK